MQNSSAMNNKHVTSSSSSTTSTGRKVTLDPSSFGSPHSSAVPCVSSPPESDSEESSLTQHHHHPLGHQPRSRLYSGDYIVDKISGGSGGTVSGAEMQHQRMIKSNDSSSSLFSAEKSRMSALKSTKVESNGFAASKMIAHKEDRFSINQSSSSTSAAAASMSVSSMQSRSSENMIAGSSSSSFAAAKQATQHHISSQHGHNMITQGSILHQTTTGGVTNGSFNNFFSNFNSRNGKFDNLLKSISPKMLTFSSDVDDDLEKLWSIAKTVKEPVISKTQSIKLKDPINSLENRMSDLCKRLVSSRTDVDVIKVMTDMLIKVWSVPKCGCDIGFTLSNIIRDTHALDAILLNIETEEDKADWKLTSASAQLLEQCLISENRNFIVEHNGLESVIKVAKLCIEKKNFEETRVGTGILEHMFKHSEETCQEVIRYNGLKTILNECRSNDILTLRHCASALANLSLHGGPESQQEMIKSKAEVWLFPLAFHKEDNIKYYACLAITVLVANKELEAAVLQSGTLDLVEPFVTSHNPEEFAKSSTSHIHGQSKNWLARLVPVLMSKREQARSLAAFHFAMEAWIKKTKDQTEVSLDLFSWLTNDVDCPDVDIQRDQRHRGTEVCGQLSRCNRFQVRCSSTALDWRGCAAQTIATSTSLDHSGCQGLGQAGLFNVRT